MRAPQKSSKRSREGAHSGERETADAVVGSVVQAASQRRRAQKGVTAAARRGHAAVLSHVRKAGKVAPAVQKEVERAMKKGTALVAASIERLETAERSWDKFVEEGGHAIDGYPTAELVVTYMVQMSRERQRMCLAQRGCTRADIQLYSRGYDNRHRFRFRPAPFRFVSMYSCIVNQ
jgi:hypothetical protein